MRKAIPPFPPTFSWHAVELGNGYNFIVWYLVKHREKFTFHL